eukprot:g718.t1 g718   contig10:585321-586557(+)
MVQRADSHDDVYDRQIRLWGADAQKRMSNARVFYINLSGVNCEIMKNLVLAGVAAVVCDNRPYPEAVREMPSSFFSAEEMEKIIAEKGASGGGADGSIEGGEPETKKAKTLVETVASAVAPKVEELNPLLTGRNSIEDRPLDSIPDEFFSQFDAIVASRLSVAQAKRISVALQKSDEKEGGNDGEECNNNTLFIVTDTFGLDGCAYLDYGRTHKFRRELGKDKMSDPMPVEPYLSMEGMMNVPLASAKGRFDKVVPRILVLHRLLMDYWEQRKEQQPSEEFVMFADEWIGRNNVPKSYDEQELQLDQLAGIANHPEVSPVAAVLGGVLGNEVIKALTRKGEPANNVMLFNGLDGGCRSFLLKEGEKSA